MTIKEFDRINRFAFTIEELMAKMMEEGRFDFLREEMEKMSLQMDSRHKVKVSVNVEIGHEDRINSLELSKAGLEIDGHGNFESSFDGCTVHKYWVRGRMYKAPHNHCPNCWAKWDYKLQQPECPHCAMKLGEDVKIFLDTGICPFCEEGKVSFDKPTCNECGTRIHPDIVIWG